MDVFNKLKSEVTVAPRIVLYKFEGIAPSVGARDDLIVSTVDSVPFLNILKKIPLGV